MAETDFRGVAEKLKAGEFQDSIPLAYLEECTLQFSPDRVIGSGGFGTVYKGIDARLQFLFAVKVLDLRKFEPQCGERQELLKTIEQETAAFRALPRHHPNLCRILGVCSREKRGTKELYALVVTSLGHRGDLASLLAHQEEAKVLTWRERLSIARQVFAAVSFLHNNSPPVLHRDIKAENVVLTTALKPMLTDWALARLVPDAQAGHHVTTGAFAVGTQGYMCPKYAAERVFTPASEVYSLGVLLLELFTGQTQNPPQKDLVKHYAGEDLYADDPDAPPLEHRLGPQDADSRAGMWEPEVAREFAELCLRCLAKDLRRRPRVSVLSALHTLREMERQADAARPDAEQYRKELERLRTAREAVLAKEAVEAHKAAATPTPAAAADPPPAGDDGGDGRKLTCLRCVDDFPVDEGAECPQGDPGHFLCRDCFDDHVKDRLEAGIEIEGDGELKIECAMKGHGCEGDGAYSQRTIALLCSDGTYARFLEERDRSQRDRIEAEVEGRVRTEVEREGLLGMYRRRIETEVLNFFVTAPCCGRMFVFEGCAAVTCTCGGKFCALCLQRCEDNQACHAHVAACPHNPQRPSFFVSREELEAAHVPELRVKIRAFLEEVRRDEPQIAEQLEIDATVRQHLAEAQQQPERPGDDHQPCAPEVQVPEDNEADRRRVEVGGGGRYILDLQGEALVGPLRGHLRGADPYPGGGVEDVIDRIMAQQREAYDRLINQQNPLLAGGNVQGGAVGGVGVPGFPFQPAQPQVQEFYAPQVMHGVQQQELRFQQLLQQQPQPQQQQVVMQQMLGGMPMMPGPGMQVGRAGRGGGLFADDDAMIREFGLENGDLDFL